jgi:MFS family permease
LLAGREPSPLGEGGPPSPKGEGPSCIVAPMSASRLTPIQWVICIIAVIGFAFDTYEILMLPLIARPALIELTGAQPGSPEFQMWVGRLFYIPAFAAGIFGLLGGYLTDRFGRRRVLTFSILLYGVSAFSSGFATSIEMLLVLRCLVYVGVCVEFIAAVAWLAELFPDPIQREHVLGYTQACSNFGGLMVATANALCIAFATSLPAIGAFGLNIVDPHAVWRYTLMTGVIPALPLILIRPFLPESPIWREKRAAGTLKRPNIRELFSPQLRRATIVSTIMLAMAYGAAFGALQQVPQMVPGVPQVQEQTRDLTPPQAAQITQRIAAQMTKWSEIGGLLGRTLLALLAVRIVSRQRLLRLFQIPAFMILPIVFGIAATSSLTWLLIGNLILGVLVIGQFSFWGNYLPRIYPVHLRGTGESFAMNTGGRLIGTCFAWVTATLAITSDPAYAPTKVALMSAVVGTSVLLIGFLLSFLLPEPAKEEL